MMRSIISFYLFVFLAHTAVANDSTELVYDTSQIEVRHFDEEKIKQHKAADEFDYGFRPEAELSLWERFKIWLMEIFNKLFYFGTNTPIGKLILYILLGAAVIYAVHKLMQMQARKLFFKEKDRGLHYDIFHEDIHEMDFEKLIDEAVANMKYRNAIRLVYLYALKHLSNKQMIDWQPGKTNHEYVDELKSGNVKKGFNDLSFYFDYAWYGDFNVDKALFEKVNGMFVKWEKDLEL